MITEIKKGDRFRCTKKHITGLNRNGITKVTEVFTEDKVYTSHKDCCLLGNNDIPLNLYSSKSLADANEFMNMYFTKLNSSNFHANTFNTIPLGADPDTQQDLTREAIEQNEVEMETADSQKLIRRFKSGAVRSDNTGRPRPDWISPYAIEAISMRMVGVVNDFGSCNYMLGINETHCLESLVRHVGELQEAILITKDKDAAKEAAQGVGFNIVAMLHTMVLKEKGLYVERFEREELVTVEEAKQGINFTDKD